MTKKPKKTSRLTAALLETAKDMRQARLMSEETYRKITMRHLGEEERAKTNALTGDDIRAMRERAHMSQAVFASCLNLTADYVSKLERGEKSPTGAALALLNVIDKKGIEVVFDRH